MSSLFEKRGEMPSVEYAQATVDSSHKTPKGRAVTIKLYVYPDGKGFWETKGGIQPLANKEQALGMFEQVWKELMERK